ncbi:MAG: TolC family protein [Deltaproteobacteria bacterium]|nr:MAG: TolC family protein [Deltaproteobacteria bacterium]
MTVHRFPAGRIVRPRRRVAGGLSVALASLVLAACGGRQERAEVALEMDVPEAFALLPASERQPVAEDSALDEAWCSDFGDPALGEVVAAVVGANLDLRVAWTRVREADALVAQVRSQGRPRVSAEASAGRGNALVPGPGGASLQTQNSFGLGATAAWEVDLWGRVGAQVRAAESDREALALDVRALEMAVSARAAEAYLEGVRVEEERRLLSEQLRVSGQFAALVEARFRVGQATALDVLQQRQNVEELESRAVGLDLEAHLARLALARLMGLAEPAEGLTLARALPAAPRGRLEVLPAELLERRPDVAAARERAVAADHRVEAALRERLPRLRLSANLALQATSIGELFDYLFWSVGSGLTQSIWEGGRVRAEVERQEAVLERALLGYVQALLGAIHEVQEGLARVAARERVLHELEGQLALATTALEAARTRYRGGDVDFLRVLTAQQAVQRLEVGLLEARRSLLLGQVDLCRVAGGIPRPAEDETEGDEP